MHRHTPQKYHSTHRPSLPLFLYDLTAANQVLPPASVLPEQFYGPSAGPKAECGEVALMRAVLEDAINCFQQPSGPHYESMVREAEVWIFSDDLQWPFSFVNICAVLGLNAEYVRLGLKRWRQNPLSVRTRKRRRDTVGRRTTQLAA